LEFENWANGPTTEIFTITKPPEKPWRRPKAMQGCSDNKEEGYAFMFYFVEIFQSQI
jgi:hypothetical protein